MMVNSIYFETSNLNGTVVKEVHEIKIFHIVFILALYSS